MIDFKHDNCAKIMILKSSKYIQNIYKSGEWKHAIVHRRGQTLNLKWITQHCRMIMSLKKGQTLTKTYSLFIL